MNVVNADGTMTIYRPNIGGGGQHISIDYDEAIAKSKELKNIANDCQAVAQSVSRVATIFEGCWKGESGQEVQNLINGWKSKEMEISEKMDMVADQIKMVADSIKKADEEAAARNRS